LRILLLGSNGQIGKELARFLPQLGNLLALDRSQVDLSILDNIRNAIRQHQPDIIVNAAGYTAVDQAEKEPEQCQLINSRAPELMAEEAKKKGALLIHYSTDYVFDGHKNSPYLESDPPNPVSVYGKTKLAGEIAIQQSGANHLIFRTAWVYGTRGRNFLLTVLRLATERKELRIVRDQIGAPTWSREIARGTTSVLTNYLAHHGKTRTERDGIYHLTASGQGSWFDFATAIIEKASRATKEIPWFKTAVRDREIVTTQVIPITTAEFSTAAKRPAYSVLANEKVREHFGVRLPEWREQLEEVFRMDEEDTSG
jgi:dTDP-4-dehydrorhamnose reductase